MNTQAEVKILEKPFWKGVVLMVAAWTLFACMSACAKHAYQHTTPIVAFFFQGFGGLLFLSPVFFKEGRSLFQSEHWKWIMARATIGALSFFCLFTSLAKIPLTDGNLLNNTGPLFVPFLAALFFKTKLRPSIFLSACIGFLGIVFILRPTSGIFDLHALPALFSGFLSAIVMILMRFLTPENPKRIIFFYLLTGIAVSAPFALPSLSSLPLEAWIPLLFCGFFFGCAQMCYTRSFQYAEPTLLAPFCYTFVVVSGLLDWLFWNHPPTFFSAVGIFFVILGGVITIWLRRT